MDTATAMATRSTVLIGTTITTMMDAGTAMTTGATVAGPAGIVNRSVAARDRP
jgi:hypothetical protein